MILWKESVISAVGDPHFLHFSDGKKIALLQRLELKGKREGGEKREGREKREGDEERRETFLAATTHLHWNPLVSFQQIEARELISAIQNMRGRKRERRGEEFDGMKREGEEEEEEEEEEAVLLGGDLNSSKGSDCFEVFLSANFRDVDDFVREEEDRKKFSVHVPRSIQDKVPDARNQKCLLNPVDVDHVMILASEKKEEKEKKEENVPFVEPLHVYHKEFVPSWDNGLPNRRWSGSDHFLIGYEIPFQLLFDPRSD